jgi:hypothetical protein
MGKSLPDLSKERRLMRKFLLLLGLLTTLAVTTTPGTASAAACYPTGFCNIEREICRQECAPCLPVFVCIISICDTTCSCQC